MAFSRLVRVLSAAAAALCSTLLCCGELRAEGREFSIQAHDLKLIIDTRWTGCRFGGYYPIRIRATNTGPARNLTFAFVVEADSRGVPSVERTIGLEQNATIQFTLSVPLAGPGNGGKLVVLQQGRPLEKMDWPLALSDASRNEAVTPALLVLSQTHIDMNPYQLAVQSIAQNTTDPYGRMSGLGYRGYSTPTAQSVVIPPVMLPESWIDYSGLDLIATSAESFGKLPLSVRTAVLQWVDTGGTLILSDAGKEPQQSELLRKSLALDSRAAVSPNWTPADPKMIPANTRPDQELPQGIELDENTRALYEAQSRKWNDKSPPFWTRTLSAGRVIAVDGDLFKTKPGDWQWLLRSIGSELTWPVRHGFSSRSTDDEFLTFEIPGLRGLPVTALLTMITIFAIIIGPINYFLLWKRKRLGLLIFTIPAIAFATSLSLFAYSTLSHGFGVKSRTRSLTLLDQTAHTAMTTTRLSLFAGVTPSSGLTFSPETAVHPIWNQGGDPYETGSINWTETQSLESGWLRSRTRTQFVTQRHRTERGRLVIKPVEGKMLPVENGFEWDIVALVVADDKGKLYTGPALDAGGATRLVSVERPGELADFTRLLGENAPRFPEGASGAAAPNYYSRRGPYYDYETSSTFQFGQSTMEMALSRLARLSGQGGELPPRSFALILRDNPGIEKGIENPSERAPLHVLIGHY